MRYKAIQTKLSKKAVWVRGIVCSLLLATAGADFITFAIEKKFRVFDMSALTVMTDNILLIFAVKFIVIGVLFWLLLKKEAGDYNRFLWLMAAVYLILFQAVGTINNRQVAEMNPPVEQAPSAEVRIQTGFNFALLYAYYPIAFAMLCFWLWNVGYRRY